MRNLFFFLLLLSSVSSFGSVLRPFASYERVGYLVIDNAAEFGAQPVKTQIIRNLPDGVQAIVLVIEGTEAEARKTYEPLLPAGRIAFVTVSPSDETDPNFPGMWDRDFLPWPVYLKTGSAPQFAGVETSYLNGSLMSPFLTQALKLPILSHQEKVDTGNFVSDALGNCLVIDGPHDFASEKVLRGNYGCQSVTSLPFMAGIGDANERVIFLGDKHVATDKVEYKSPLEKAGFQVTLLLEARYSIENYANSITVNGVIMMPTFNEPSDGTAQGVYEKAGFHVIPIDSKDLINIGWGALNCITMTYPVLQ